jgi:hypothetical protein
MILARWRGFEIDSSEGYFYFNNPAKSADEGWDFMLRLLGSPLVWDRVAFDVCPAEGQVTKVIGHIEAVLERAVPREYQTTSEYCQFRFAAGVETFLGLAKALRPSLASIHVNFCLAPFNEIPVEELARLKTWFFKQFSDREEANWRWKCYSRVRPADFMFRGHSEMTDEWAENYAFEALFDLGLTPPFSYGMSVSAGDPSLMLYLLGTLTARYDLKFSGDHISINRQPDLLDLEISPEEEDDEEDEDGGPPE